MKAHAPFEDLPRGYFGAILCDAPWRFETWSAKGEDRSPDYQTMTLDGLTALPVVELAAPDCVLIMWATWPMLPQALEVIAAWQFEYKTCAFDWMKADASKFDLFEKPITADMKLGYWTRSNSEPALLATRGKPKRTHADVRMGIIEKTREHSRKPDCIHERIERLVAGPYLELFARQKRKGWSNWGNETEKFKVMI